MKTLIAALLVLVVVSPGESLVCKCGGFSRDCPSPTEVCKDNKIFCGNIRVNPEDPKFFRQGCMEPRECRGFDVPGWNANCCSTDLCNARDGLWSMI